VKDWNVVVSVFQDGYSRALRALQKLGVAERGPYHNVLVMKVEDPVVLLEAIEKRTEETPALYDAISRVAPAMRDFDFLSEAEFVEKAKSIIRESLPRLAGRSFHVRLRRHGTIHELRTQDAERLFNDAIVDATTQMATPGKISFTDSDVVIAIDTVDNRAGLAMWTREELARFHLLRPD
jgi:adenylyl- and sulfurtransferase ThiI